MKIVDAGYFVGNSQDQIEFFSNTYFLDHHVLRVKLSSLKEELEDLIGFDEESSLTSKQKDLMDHWIYRKTEEIQQFYTLKGDVIIIADIYPEKYYCKDKRRDEWFSIDFLRIFIPSAFYPNYEPHEGSIMTVHSSMLELVSKSQTKYHFTIEVDESVKPLATTQKTNKPIAFAAKITQGRLLLLNDLDFNLSEILDFEKWFASQSRQMLSQLDENLEDIALISPDWVEKIRVEKHEEIISKINLLEAEQLRIKTEITDHQRQANKYEILKSILFASGTLLEKGIASAMGHLGIRYNVPDKSETDLIIQEGNICIAVEVKGVTGTASLKNSRQLEDWVNKTANEYELEEVKGLLLINCFHQLPLEERQSLLFPPNVIEFSRNRGHCLLTTSGLFNMILDFDKGILDKNKILDLIVNTNGVLEYP